MVTNRYLLHLIGPIKSRGRAAPFGHAVPPLGSRSMTPAGSTLLKSAEVAELLRVHPKQVYRLLARGLPVAFHWMGAVVAAAVSADSATARCCRT